MKQFNLNEYLKTNKKVVTRDRRDVRIICTDHENSLYPVIGVIKGCDSPTLFSKYGQTSGTSTDEDLFFELDKHEGWINVYRDGIAGARIFDTSDLAKEYGMRHTNYVDTIKIEWEE